jgi:O-antigen ligase
MYSVFLSIAALLSLSFTIINKTKSKKILFFILFVLFTILLFIGIGRTGEVIYIVGVYLILLKNIENKLKTTLLLTMIMGILGFALYSTNYNFKERIDFIKTDLVELENDNYYTSIGGRIVTWNISYDIVKNNPLLGVGIIDHSDYLKKSISENKNYAKCPLLTKMNYFHAQFIEIITQLGIIGVLIFTSLFYILAKIKLDNKTMQNLNLILLTSTLLFFLVDMPFRRQFFIAFFALISGVIIAQLKHERELKR